MKIMLSKDEAYEIKLPEQIEIQEFAGIVSKFNFLLKNFSRFSLSGEDSTGGGINLDSNLVSKRNRNPRRWKVLMRNRKLFIELMNSFFNSDKETFKEFVNKNNLGIFPMEMNNASIWRLKEYHKFKPQDIGLTSLPKISDILKSWEGKQNE